MNSDADARKLAVIDSPEWVYIQRERMLYKYQQFAHARYPDDPHNRKSLAEAAQIGTVLLALEATRGGDGG